MPNIIFDSFINSLTEVFKEMAGLDVKLEGAMHSECDEMMTLGVVSVINFNGKLTGRVLLDMEPHVAISAAQNITSSTQYVSERDTMVLAVISEMNNILCGKAIAPINNKLGLKLWMSPPYVFAGKDTTICIPKVPSTSLNYTTIYGKLRLNLAFEKEA